MQNDTYNRGGYIAFLFSMTFSLAFFVYISFQHPGVKLNEAKPKDVAVEQSLAGQAGAAAIDVSKIEKPWVESAELIGHGEKVYTTNCAVCHGPKGAGDGPAGRGLVPPPRDLVEGNWKQGGDSISQWNTLAKGIAGTSMASFGHLPAVDRWAVIHYIHSITQNRVKDDPAKLEEFAKTAK
jgi:mono/diheme cytochrome c family protein